MLVLRRKQFSAGGAIAGMIPGLIAGGTIGGTIAKKSAKKDIENAGGILKVKLDEIKDIERDKKKASKKGYIEKDGYYYSTDDIDNELKEKREEYKELVENPKARKKELSKTAGRSNKTGKGLLGGAVIGLGAGSLAGHLISKRLGKR